MHENTVNLRLCLFMCIQFIPMYYTCTHFGPIFEGKSVYYMQDNTVIMIPKTFRLLNNSLKKIAFEKLFYAVRICSFLSSLVCQFLTVTFALCFSAYADRHCAPLFINMLSHDPI